MGDNDSEFSSSEDESTEEEDDGPEYGNLHRYVLQGFMAGGYLEAAAVKTLFQRAHSSLNKRMSEGTEMQLIKEVIQSINRKISRFNMGIKSVTCELTGKKAYTFSLTAESPMMTNQTHFSKFEVDMFKLSLNLFLRENENFTARVPECMNLSRKVEAKNSIAMAEAFVNKMIAGHYFVKVAVRREEDVEDEDEDFSITLGIRAIRELEPTIKELYPDALVPCGLCKMTMLHGYKCPGRRCGYFVHIPCHKAYIKGSKECPNCKKSWADPAAMIKRKKEPEESQDGGSSGSEDEAEETRQGSENVTSLLSPVATGRNANGDKSDSDTDTELSPTAPDADGNDVDTQLTPATAGAVEDVDTQLTPLELDMDQEDVDTQLTPVPVDMDEDDVDTQPTPVQMESMETSGGEYTETDEDED